MISVPFPIGRWWRLVYPPAPRRLTVRLGRSSGELEGMTQLRVDSQPIGWIHPHGYALWIESVHKELPRVLAAAEELAWQRALYAAVLLQRSPSDAHRLSMTNDSLPITVLVPENAYAPIEVYDQHAAPQAGSC